MDYIEQVKNILELHKRSMQIFFSQKLKILPRQTGQLWICIGEGEQSIGLLRLGFFYIKKEEEKKKEDTLVLE